MKTHILGCLLPERGGNCVYATASELSPGTPLCADVAAAAGQLQLLQLLEARGGRCTDDGMDDAAANGHGGLLRHFEDCGGATQRWALTRLYGATDGDNWRRREKWCSDEPIDNWQGVKLHKKPTLDLENAGL